MTLIFPFVTSLLVTSILCAGSRTTTAAPSGLAGVPLSENDDRTNKIIGNGFPSLLEYTFDNFIRQYQKQYESKEEYELRKVIFYRNKDVIIRHNHGRTERHHKHNYTLGITQFADRLETELPMGLDKKSVKYHSNTQKSVPSSIPFEAVVRRRRNLRQPANGYDKANHRNFVNGRTFDINALPEFVDWRSKNGAAVTTPIKNQGKCGSCWAFAATAALESHIAIETSTLFDLSVQEFVSCTPNPNACGGHGGCTGSTAELAYAWVAEHGIVEEWRFGYQSFHGEVVNCTIIKSYSSERKEELGTDPKDVDGAGKSSMIFVDLLVRMAHRINLTTLDFLFCDPFQLLP
jgi:cathepsin L